MTMDELRNLPAQRLLDLYVDCSVAERGRVTRVLKQEHGIDVSRFAQKLHSRIEGTAQVNAHQRVKT